MNSVGSRDVTSIERVAAQSNFHEGHLYML